MANMTLRLNTEEEEQLKKLGGELRKNKNDTIRYLISAYPVASKKVLEYEAGMVKERQRAEYYKNILAVFKQAFNDIISVK